jgi:hypothetical protein
MLVDRPSLTAGSGCDQPSARRYLRAREAQDRGARFQTLALLYAYEKNPSS